MLFEENDSFVHVILQGWNLNDLRRKGIDIKQLLYGVGIPNCLLLESTTIKDERRLVQTTRKRRRESSTDSHSSAPSDSEDEIKREIEEDGYAEHTEVNDSCSPHRESDLLFNCSISTIHPIDSPLQQKAPAVNRTSTVVSNRPNSRYPSLISTERESTMGCSDHLEPPNPMSFPTWPQLNEPAICDFRSFSTDRRAKEKEEHTALTNGNCPNDTLIVDPTILRAIQQSDSQSREDAQREFCSSDLNCDDNLAENDVGGTNEIEEEVAEKEERREMMEKEEVAEKERSREKMAEIEEVAESERSQDMAQPMDATEGRVVEEISQLKAGGTTVSAESPTVDAGTTVSTEGPTIDNQAVGETGSTVLADDLVEEQLISGTTVSTCRPTVESQPPHDLIGESEPVDIQSILSDEGMEEFFDCSAFPDEEGSPEPDSSCPVGPTSELNEDPKDTTEDLLNIISSVQENSFVADEANQVSEVGKAEEERTEGGETSGNENTPTNLDEVTSQSHEIDPEAANQSSRSRRNGFFYEGVFFNESFRSIMSHPSMIRELSQKDQQGQGTSLNISSLNRSISAEVHQDTENAQEDPLNISVPYVEREIVGGGGTQAGKNDVIPENQTEREMVDDGETQRQMNDVIFENQREKREDTIPPEPINSNFEDVREEHQLFDPQAAKGEEFEVENVEKMEVLENEAEVQESGGEDGIKNESFSSSYADGFEDSFEEAFYDPEDEMGPPNQPGTSQQRETRSERMRRRDEGRLRWKKNWIPSAKPVRGGKKEEKREQRKTEHFQCQYPSCSTVLHWQPKYGRTRILEHLRRHTTVPRKYCKVEGCGFAGKTVHAVRYHHSIVHGRWGRYQHGTPHGRWGFPGVRDEETQTDMEHLLELWKECFPDIAPPHKS